MKGKKSFFIAACLMIFGVILLVTKTKCPPSLELGNQNFKIECALTKQAQEQGLSGRENLAESTGMLFVFPQPGFYSFWMKDMNFPLDMIWLDQNKKVVFIANDVATSTYPDGFVSKVPAKFVLEVNAGTAAKLGIKEGDEGRF